MNVQQSTSTPRLIPRITAFVIALCTSANLYAVTTYQIEPAGFDGWNIITGGTITTDDTLGPLSASNIVSMSVDISLRSFVGNSSGVFEILDGSTTLDLTNSTLTVEGLVQATPTAIRIERADQVGERNILSLVGTEGASATWSSAYYEYDFSAVFRGAGIVTGFSHTIGISAPPAGFTFAGLSASGVITQVVPEPATMLMALLGLFVLMPKARRGRR
jgi:hypothetical protein